MNWTNFVAFFFFFLPTHGGCSTFNGYSLREMRACEDRNELGIFHDQSESQCADACDANAECVSFEMKNSECRLSTTCMEPHIGYYYTTCLWLKESCSEINGYKLHTWAGCADKNELGTFTDNFIGCATRCYADDECISFEWISSSNTCRLSKTCVESHITSYPSTCTWVRDEALINAMHGYLWWLVCPGESDTKVNAFYHDNMPNCEQICDLIIDCMGYALRSENHRCFIYTHLNTQIPGLNDWTAYEQDNDIVTSSFFQENVDCHWKLYSISGPPTDFPSSSPTNFPTPLPSSSNPTILPSTNFPTLLPSSNSPTILPSTNFPTLLPSSSSPTILPSTNFPTLTPSDQPSMSPTLPECGHELKDLVLNSFDSETDCLKRFANPDGTLEEKDCHCVLLFDLDLINRTEAASCRYHESHELSMLDTWYYCNQTFYKSYIADCPILNVINGNATYLDNGARASITCESPESLKTVFNELVCVVSKWRWESDAKISITSLECGPYKTSTISSNATSIQKLCKGPQDCADAQITSYTSCGDIVLKKQDYFCGKEFYVDTYFNPTFCGCKSSEKVSSTDEAENIEGYKHFQLTVCSTPDLPSHAQIHGEQINSGFKQGVATVKCDEGYVYEGDPIICDTKSEWSKVGSCTKEPFKEDCVFVVAISCVSFCVYNFIMLCISYCYLGEETSKTIHVSSQRPSCEDFDRKRSMYVNQSFTGQLFGGQLLSPNILFLDMEMKPLRKSAYTYFCKGLGRTKKALILMNVLDFTTDALFAADAYETHPCIGMVSGGSFVLSTSAYLMAFIVDYLAWQRYYDEEDRNLIYLRWAVLVLTPAEDMIQSILVVYLFANDAANFYSYLCVLFGSGMILGRLFKLILAAHGGLQSTNRMSQVPQVEFSTPAPVKRDPAAHLSEPPSIDKGSDVTGAKSVRESGLWMAELEDEINGEEINHRREGTAGARNSQGAHE